MKTEHEYHNVECIRILANKGDFDAEAYTVNRDGLRGRIYIPVHKYPEIEEQVLQQNWNIRDVLTEGGYKTYLEVNFELDAATVKVCYSNNRYEWISVREWQTNPAYEKSWIHEMKISPYFFTDVYQQELIAGQLKFAEIHMEEDVVPVAPDTWNKPDTSTSNNNRDLSLQLVNVVYALGLTPKDAIKILIEEV